MIDRMIDRCKRICGDINKDHCFVNDKHQLSCISDMAVNKTTSIAMVLEFALMDDDPEFLRENIREAITQNNELLNWIKYLQLAGDLRRLSTMVLDSDENEKRKEIRYPILEDTPLALSLALDGEEFPIELINFSQSGLRFSSPKELNSQEPIQCRLISAPPSESAKDMTIAVKYCASQGESYTIGAKVERFGTQNTFNVFSHIYQLHMDTAMF